MIKIGTTSAKSKYMKENYKMRTSVGRVQGTANAIKNVASKFLALIEIMIKHRGVNFIGHTVTVY